MPDITFYSLKLRQRYKAEFYPKKSIGSNTHEEGQQMLCSTLYGRIVFVLREYKHNVNN